MTISAHETSTVNVAQVIRRAEADHEITAADGPAAQLGPTLSR
ncbi:hypothetical protein [uncultured Mycobacterium sp.]